MHDFTPDLTEAIERHAAAGCSQRMIADLIGVPRRSFEDWIRKGDEGIEPFCRASVALRRATATTASAALGDVLGGEKHSNGAQWWLERTYPEDFGNRTKLEVEHSGTIGVQVVSFRDVPMEEIMALASGREKPRIVDVEAVAVPTLAIGANAETLRRE